MQISSPLIALLPLAGVLVGALLQHFLGRTLELQKYLSSKKGEAYADYFRAVAAISTKGPSDDRLSHAAEAKTRICIYGSAEAISCLGDFERSGAKTGTAEGRTAIVSFLRAARRDMKLAGPEVEEHRFLEILFGNRRENDLKSKG